MQAQGVTTVHTVQAQRQRLFGAGDLAVASAITRQVQQLTLGSQRIKEARSSSRWPV